MNHQIYYDAGEVAIAANYKVASASLARAVIKAHHPEFESLLTSAPGKGKGTAYPEGRNADNWRWHGTCPRGRDNAVPALLVVRDPVEKFRSACAEARIENVDTLLDELATGENRNIHFTPQSRFLSEGRELRLYRFETDLEQLASDAGLEWPLPQIGPAGHNGAEKPDLTADQVARVEALYADDISLHKSIKTPGQVYASPLGLHDKEAKLSELRSARWQAEVAGIEVGGRQIGTDKGTQEELGKAVAIASLDPKFSVDWEFPDGEIVKVGAEQIQGMVLAVAAHVQGTRTKFAQLKAQVDAVTTREELEAITW